MKKKIPINFFIILLTILFCSCSLGNKKDIETKIESESKLDVEEFIIQADSWIDDFDSVTFEKTQEMVAMKDGAIPINKIIFKNNSQDKFFDKLNKYYSKDVANGELLRFAIVYNEGMFSQIEGVVCTEIRRVDKDHPISVLIDEPNRKLVKVPKVHPDIKNSMEFYIYEITKNEKNQWVISYEENYNYDYKQIVFKENK